MKNKVVHIEYTDNDDILHLIKCTEYCEMLNIINHLIDEGIDNFKIGISEK